MDIVRSLIERMSTSCPYCETLYKQAVDAHQDMLRKLRIDFPDEAIKAWEEEYPIKREHNLCWTHEVDHWNESFAKLRKAHASQLNEQ